MLPLDNTGEKYVDNLVGLAALVLFPALALVPVALWFLEMYPWQ